MEDPRTRRLLERERRRAERLRQLAEGPPSPCIAVCRINATTRLCDGCFRTIDEIRDWIIMPPAERQKLLVELRQRRMAQSPATPGAHAARPKEPGSS